MKIRVLHVIDGLGASGGAERQLALNLQFLDHEKFEHHVAHVSPRVGLAPEIAARGIPVHSLGLTGENQWFRGVWRLVKLIRKHQIDVVHTSLFQSEVIGGIAGRITRRPVIGSFVSSSYGPEWLVDNPELSAWKLRIVKILRSLLVRTCYAHMMAVSDAAKDSAVMNLRISPGKISVVHRGLGPQWTDVDVHRLGDERVDEMRQALGVSDASPLLVSIGRLSPPKGHRYLLEAMPRLREMFPNIKLLIVGEKTIGPQLELLRTQLELKDSVEFLGVRNDVKELISAADICVYPSLYEGFPNAAVEAAAMGIPLVVTNIAPYQEVLEHNVSALMVEPRSSDQLVEAIGELVRDPEWASELGSLARDQVISRFNVDVTVSKLAGLYEQLHFGRRYSDEFVGIN